MPCLAGSGFCPWQKLCCREVARHVIVWNNPKLHTPDREKTWGACDTHLASLSEHLDVRGFLRRVDPR